MKHVMGLAVVIFIGILAWRIGGTLSSDALSMAVGVLFGVLAGIPTALLVATGYRSRDDQLHPHTPSEPPINVTNNYVMMPPSIERCMVDAGGNRAVQDHNGFGPIGTVGHQYHEHRS